MKIIYARSGKRHFQNIISGLLLMLMLVIAPNSGLADTYIQQPTDDALVNTTKPEKNYINYYLSVYFDGTVYNRSYLKFDLSSIPDSAKITKAELWLYSFTSGNSSIKPLVALNHVFDDTWSESTLTWSNRPAFDAAILDSSTPSVSAWQTLDLLKGNTWNYKADLADNYLSLIIKEGEALGSTVKQVWYSPDEYSVLYPTNPPRLEITYMTPEPTTMLLVGLGLVGLAGIRRKLEGKK